MTTSKRKPITESKFLTTKLEEWHSIKEKQPDYKFTDQQALILEYADKPDKSSSDLRKLAALVKAEQAEERALAAKMQSDKIIQERAAAKKKERNKKIFNTCAMLINADLMDGPTADLKVDRDALYGALLELARIFKSSDPNHIECRKAWAASVKPADPVDPVEAVQQPEPEEEFDPLSQPVQYQ